MPQAWAAAPAPAALLLLLLPLPPLAAVLLGPPLWDAEADDGAVSDQVSMMQVSMGLPHSPQETAPPRAVRGTVAAASAAAPSAAAPLAAPAPASPTTFSKAAVVAPVAAVEALDSTIDNGLAMASSGAWILCLSAVLLVAGGLRLKPLAGRLAGRKELPEPPASPTPPGPSVEALPAAPQPEPRLPHIRASFVVPDAHIASCTSSRLGFQVPTVPGGWSLRALLSRPAESGPWASLELLVANAADDSHRLLLTCSPASQQPECCEGTGGTECSPTPDAAAAGTSAAPDAGGARPEACASGDGSCGGSSGVGEGPWLQLCGADDRPLATISRPRDGRCVFQRHDNSLWDVEARLGGGEPCITVTRQGRLIAQARSRARGGKGSALQLDVEPEARTPDACALLACTLAMVVFRP